MSEDTLKYPIGVYIAPKPITDEQLEGFIKEIENFPAELKEVAAKLTEKDLDIPYRPGGWTARQVIHHIADSHMNALIRFKLALTEDMPAIKPYFEDKWAELADYKTTPVKVSLDLIEGIHIRWINLLRSMNRDDFEKIYFHPEHGTEFSLDEMAGMYAWHGKHHLEHIKLVIN